MGLKAAYGQGGIVGASGVLTPNTTAPTDLTAVGGEERCRKGVAIWKGGLVSLGTAELTGAIVEDCWSAK